MLTVEISRANEWNTLFISTNLLILNWSFFCASGLDEKAKKVASLKAQKSQPVADAHPVEVPATDVKKRPKSTGDNVDGGEMKSDRESTSDTDNNDGVVSPKTTSHRSEIIEG